MTIIIIIIIIIFITIIFIKLLHVGGDWLFPSCLSALAYIDCGNTFQVNKIVRNKNDKFKAPSTLNASVNHQIIQELYRI